MGEGATVRFVCSKAVGRDKDVVWHLNVGSRTSVAEARLVGLYQLEGSEVTSTVTSPHTCTLTVISRKYQKTILNVLHIHRSNND